MVPISNRTANPAGELARGTVSGRLGALRSWTRGGTDGNEQLTAITGVVLIGLLLVIGVTILRIRQLISAHLFIGLLLIGPVTLKLASTGYRFMRYYTRNRAYRKKGPPELWLRLIAPVVALTTVVVFVTGVVLLFVGPLHRNPWLELHKVAFIVWAVFTALHVLGHLPGLGTSVRVGMRLGAGGTGATGRWIALTSALVAGLVLAIVLIPDFHTWTARGAFPHHHHDHG
jgi:hypothetical protein